MPLLPTPVLGSAGHVAAHAQIHGKLNEKISPHQDFGADDTGATDATVALQAAFDAASDGGWVDLGRGTYKVSDQGSGWCLDISQHSSFRLSGHGHPRMNPSGQGGSAALIYTEQVGKQILRHVSTPGQNHAGPLIEHIRFEDRGGNCTLLYIDSFLHGTIFNCEFRGFGGTTTGYGIRKLNTAGDSSYWTIDHCGILKNSIGLSDPGTDHISHCYVNGTGVTNAIGIQVLPGTGMFTALQNKFEMGDTAGTKAISIGGVNGVNVSHNAFEGCPEGIYLEDLGAAQNTGVQLVSNMFTGANGTERCIYVGTNHQNTDILGGRYSNVTTQVTDNGVDTRIIGGRAFSTDRRLITMGGVGMMVGSGAPTFAAPNGTIYLRTNGSGTTDNLYIRRGGAWVGIA